MENDIFTSVIRTRGSKKTRVVSVKSDRPVDTKHWIEFSRIISTIYVSLPIKIGDVLCRNIGNTGIDIISTCNIDKD